MAAPPRLTKTELLTDPEPSASYLIVFEDVVLAFEDTPVLNGISFRLSKGETKAIFGVAGSGKSTILKLTLGLLKPDSGHIYVLGEEITERKKAPCLTLLRFEKMWLSGCSKKAMSPKKRWTTRSARP
jgi:ABC-type multidrug transport system fused ATPase/permease subunit